MDETYYANVVDSVGDGVIVLDNNGAVTLVNPAAEEMAGVSRRQALGGLFSTIFKGEGPLNDMVAKTVATGMSVSDHENIVLNRNGKLTPVGASTSPLLSSNGERIGTIVLLRDLTNVRELEEAVRQADRLSSLGALSGTILGTLINGIVSVIGIDFSQAMADINLDVSGKIFTSIQPVSIVTVLCFAVVVSMIASYFPARQASRMEPVDALRE